MTVRSTRPRAGERKAARAAKARADANGKQPQGSLRIIETRVYRGPNYWSYDPTIKLIVDLGVLEAFPSNTIPGFVDGLLELMPAVLNAANEIAVHAFLNGRLDFLGIPAVIEETLERLPAGPVRAFESLYEADREARAVAGEQLAAHA